MKKRQYSTNLPPDLAEWVDKKAEKMGISKSAVIQIAVKEKKEKEGK